MNRKIKMEDNAWLFSWWTWSQGCVPGIVIAPNVSRSTPVFCLFEPRISKSEPFLFISLIICSTFNLLFPKSKISNFSTIVFLSTHRIVIHCFRHLNIYINSLKNTLPWPVPYNKYNISVATDTCCVYSCVQQSTVQTTEIQGVPKIYIVYPNSQQPNLHIAARDQKFSTNSDKYQPKCLRGRGDKILILEKKPQFFLTPCCRYSTHLTRRPRATRWTSSSEPWTQSSPRSMLCMRPFIFLN